MKHRGLLTFILLGLTLFIFACSADDNKIIPADPIPVLTTGDVVSFTLIQTTDVHHHVVGTGPSASYGTANDTTEGGYSRIARVIQNIKTVKGAQGIPTVLVDSGDFFMGTVYDMSLVVSPAAFAFMKSMDYDAVTLGNHEFDWGSDMLGQFFYYTSDGLSSSIQFDVPVVASNMVTNGATRLEVLKEAGEIKESLILTLDNGLKVGILGLMGPNAKPSSTVSTPVTFVTDWDGDGVDDDGDGTADEDVAAVQTMVDDLRTAGAHVVIVLSHSGIIDPNGSPFGDDVGLANAVTGIDIIVSGHEHEMTNDVVPIDNGTNDTLIICAGRYGENVAQLDVTVTIGTGVTGTPTLTNNAIDDTLDENDVLKMFLVGVLDSGINEALVAAGLFEVNEVIAANSSTNMDYPDTVGETGIGNLAADSLRFIPVISTMAGGGAAFPCMSIVPRGLIRNGFQTGGVSFADIYNTLPLGMTPDEDNQNIPGYPLLTVYLDSASVVGLCNLASYVIAANDSATMAALSTVGSPYYNINAYNALLPLKGKGDYYLNFSGIKYTRSADFSVAPGDILFYGSTDFSCQSAASTPLSAVATALSDRIPCVIDLYTANVFLSGALDAILGGSLNVYVDIDGVGMTALTPQNVYAARMDWLPGTSGIQELKMWQALMIYIIDTSLGLSSSIPDDYYDATSLASEDASRVNN